jgi:hypothetical protein
MMEERKSCVVGEKFGYGKVKLRSVGDKSKLDVVLCIAQTDEFPTRARPRCLYTRIRIRESGDVPASSMPKNS